MASNLQGIVPFSTVNDTPDDYCFYRRYEEAEPCEASNSDYDGISHAQFLSNSVCSIVTHPHTCYTLY